MTPLWTPNRKTVDPLPICLRCGGLDAGNLKIDRRDVRRYLSLHRICCCGPCTVIGGSCEAGSSIDITFAGVDIAICANLCTTVSGDFELVSAALDGTYTIDYFDYLGGLCRYIGQADTTPDITRWSSGDGSCSGTEIDGGPPGIQINCYINLNGGSCALVDWIDAYIDNGHYILFRYDAGTARLGSGVYSKLTTCGNAIGGYYTAAEGGTATITYNPGP